MIYNVEDQVVSMRRYITVQFIYGAYYLYFQKNKDIN